MRHFGLHLLFKAASLTAVQRLRRNTQSLKQVWPAGKLALACLDRLSLWWPAGDHAAFV